MVKVIDLKILEELKKNSRQSYSEIAKIIGSTEATVRRRVQKLIENKIIESFTIEFHLNSKPKISVIIKLKPDFKQIKKILKELKETEEITDIWKLSGDCGLLIKMELNSIKDFNRVLEQKLSQIDDMKIVETCFITKVIK